MDCLEILLPVLLCAAIGYCTNYIAIKMLFRPRKERHIFGKRVPFTPGVIPKNQRRIAGAVAAAVDEQLLTREDLLGKVLNEESMANLADLAAEKIISSDTALGQIGEMAEVPDRVGDFIAVEVVNTVEETDLTPLIADIAETALADYLRNPMISLFLNQAVLTDLYGKIGDSIKDYLRENGRALVNGIASEKIRDLCDAPISQTFDKLDLNRKLVSSVIAAVFQRVAGPVGTTLLETV
ncbi:MAG: DUF445 family protein, partial [Ruminiclostridium sp.]|nr:DUF445 family protein [Ruminiclostridium sp.]